MSKLTAFVGNVKYRTKRAIAPWYMEDEAVYKRLIKSGRVVYGRASYGIPTIREFAYDESKLLVGNYCSIGGTYLLGGQHAIKHVTTYPLRINLGFEGAGYDGNPAVRGDIVVGSDVWTGYGSWILSGVTIGHGAVVATGSVVTKDIPPYAIVGGIPAKVLRYRHTPEQIEALLEIAWWNWSEAEVYEAIPYLANEDIDAFIAYARAKKSAP